MKENKSLMIREVKDVQCVTDALINVQNRQLLFLEKEL